MKKNYNKPELLIEEIKLENVICTSGNYTPNKFTDLWGSSKADATFEW